jgi:beta-glucosidase
LLTDVLRKDWGFQGLVLSDAFAVGSLVTHGYARDGEDAAYKAITAGLNMDMASLTYSHNLAKLVKDGKVSEKYIDEMVLPILEVKYDLGLFERPYADESKVDATLSRPEGLALERKLASRSMVLLLNENSTLPLSKSLKKVAVIGPLADSKQEIEGGWTVEGLFSPGGGKSHPVTVFEGIKNKLGQGAQIILVAGPMPVRLYPGLIDSFSGRKPAAPPTPEEIADWIAKAKPAAADADIVVAVMGETASMSGEAASRSNLDLRFPGTNVGGRSINREAGDIGSRSGAPARHPLGRGACSVHPRSVVSGNRGRRCRCRCSFRRRQPRREIADKLAADSGVRAALLQPHPHARTRGWT